MSFPDDEKWALTCLKPLAAGRGSWSRTRHGHQLCCYRENRPDTSHNGFQQYCGGSSVYEELNFHLKAN